MPRGGREGTQGYELREMTKHEATRQTGICTEQARWEGPDALGSWISWRITEFQRETSSSSSQGSAAISDAVLGSWDDAGGARGSHRHTTWNEATSAKKATV